MACKDNMKIEEAEPKKSESPTETSLRVAIEMLREFSNTGYLSRERVNQFLEQPKIKRLLK